MLAVERQPDADAAFGVDLPLAVAFDVAELAGRGVIEGEDDR